MFTLLIFEICSLSILYERRKRYCWRLKNLEALVTFGFEDPYEGGARQFLSARARGDSREGGVWYYFYNLDEVVPYIFPCARTLGKTGNDMV